VAHVEGDETQPLIVPGCLWPVPGDSDRGPRARPVAQHGLRDHNACLVAAAFADAGMTAIINRRDHR